MKNTATLCRRQQIFSFFPETSPISSSHIRLYGTETVTGFAIGEQILIRYIRGRYYFG
jgi:hypothetical protein